MNYRNKNLTRFTPLSDTCLPSTVAKRPDMKVRHPSTYTTTLTCIYKGGCGVAERHTIHLTQISTTQCTTRRERHPILNCYNGTTWPVLYLLLAQPSCIQPPPPKKHRRQTNPKLRMATMTFQKARTFFFQYLSTVYHVCFAFKASMAMLQ